MENLKATSQTADDLAKRRVPCLISYLHPFRMVESEALAEWSLTIEDVNQGCWDYVALREIAGGTEVGLPSPYHMIIARDGGLALPPLEGLRSHHAAVEYFNRCLAGLLIGGVYCEAVTPDGLDVGSIIDWRYMRSHTSGLAAPNRFHRHIRYRQASSLEAIELFHPRTISLLELNDAMKIGLAVLDRVKALRGEYLLRGVTGLARRDWGTALANLWIVVEQLISELWCRHVVAPTIAVDPGRSRRDQLSDTRAWTTSNRLEMLFQKQVVPLDMLKALSVARKARNNLSHEGEHPNEHAARSAFEGVRGLLTVALAGERPPILDLDLADHTISDPIAPPKRIVGEPEFWMEIPKLPGELDLEKAEASFRRDFG